MKKLLIAAVVGALSSTLLVTAEDASAQTSSSTTTKPAAKPATKAKRPQPKRLFKRKENPAKEAKVDPIPEGSEKWTCKEGLSFDMKGDMKRDQIVTVHWANKNYQLPREATTTGADRFHDSQDAGIDRVTDFSYAQGDRVMLDPGTTFTASQVGADTVLDMGGGNQMILVGVTLANLPADYVFFG